jgi:ribosomal protein S18 acetylase RimI-like enzyme
VREDVSLRPIQPSDAEFLYRVYASTRETELSQVPWSGAHKEAFLRMQFDAQTREWSANYPRASFQAVMVGGEPAGRLYVDRREDEIRVVDVALLPAFRGRGIGGALLAAVLKEADAAGKPVTIHVERFNPARRLYERLGFRLQHDRGVYLLLERPPAPSVERGP